MGAAELATVPLSWVQSRIVGYNPTELGTVPLHQVYLHYPTAAGTVDTLQAGLGLRDQQCSRIVANLSSTQGLRTTQSIVEMQ